MFLRVIVYDYDKYYLCGNFEVFKLLKFLGDQMDREMLFIEDSRFDGYNVVILLGYLENQWKGIIRIDFQRLSVEDGEMNIIEDGNFLGYLSFFSKGFFNLNLLEIE